jgi:hypothetical protein
MYRLGVRPTLRTITVAALVLNALLFGFEAISSGPDDISVPHVIISLVFAGIVALRLRWAPALGALLCAAQLVEGYIFLSSSLTEPDTTATFAFAAIFFAISIIGLVAGVGATVQNYRAPRSRPFIDPPAPRWTYPALFALIALIIGGILSTAIQSHGVSANFSPEALAALPALTAKDDMFDQQNITAKVGETVVLRLDNADTTTHYWTSTSSTFPRSFHRARAMWRCSSPHSPVPIPSTAIRTPIKLPAREWSVRWLSNPDISSDCTAEVREDVIMNKFHRARLAGQVCLAGATVEIIYGLLAIPFGPYMEKTTAWGWDEMLWAVGL